MSHLMDFPDGNIPVFPYQATVPWNCAQMQHEWPVVVNEYTKKRRSTVRTSTILDNELIC